MRVIQEGNLMEKHVSTYEELTAITSAPLGCVGFVVKSGTCDWYMWNGTSWDYKGVI